ncbi:MAG: phosphoribosylformylglycinamidine synthase subunit PurS, partial [Aquificaceae bacterium]
MKVKVLILPKRGLLDPEGRAVKEMLVDEGFPVKEVKVGKVVEIELERDMDIKRMV